ncbi:MAG: phage holin family protein [Burkholderiaceae bacterium]|nr:phage holin family protein [Burkholderiaceae bacterium]
MVANPQPGLLGSARQVLVALIDIGQTRLQLASTELEEERLRVAELLLYAAAALFFLGIGLVLAALLLVLLYWNSQRELVLGGVTAVFLVIGVGLAMAWRRKAGRKPRLLATTIDELRCDRDALQGGMPGR